MDNMTDDFDIISKPNFESKKLRLSSVISRYFYIGVLFIWMLLLFITMGMMYHIIYKDGFSKISDHFEWLVDRVNGL